MANALSMPEPPDIPQQAGEGSAPPGPLNGQGQNGLVQPGGAPPQPAPAPTHQMTVAALRHFDAVRSTWEKVAQDPNLGKSSVKKAIIDGAMKLVADRFVKPKDAVTMLGLVPENPQEQRKWITKQIQQNQMAENLVLEHHRQAFAGMPGPDPGAMGSMDTHQDDMAGLMGHYKRG